MEEEIWKKIDLCDGLYYVSSLGRIKNSKNIILKQQPKDDGYLYIKLPINSKRKKISMHRIVAITFLENKNNYPQVNHMDEVKTNNNVNNLEWCTGKYNSNYGTAQKRRAIKRSVAIIQMDINYNFIKEWQCVSDAERAGYRTGCISNCCVGRTFTHAGYRWKYKDDSHTPLSYITKKTKSKVY